MHNFVLDLAAFLAVRVLLERDVKARRILAGAAAGTCGNCLAFLLCGNTAAYLLAVHFLVNPVVLYLIFRQRDKRTFFTDWGVSYVVFLFVGGIMEWLYEGGGFNSYEPAAALTLLLLTIVLLWGKQRLKNHIRYMDVWICQDGRKIRLRALSDSGNLLREPYQGRPVSIIDRRTYEAVFGLPKTILLIPYESLGCTNGLLETVGIQEIGFVQGSRQCCIKGAALGLADHALFHKKPYQIILNPQELMHHQSSGR